MKRIGILYNPKLAGAVAFGDQLKSFFASYRIEAWLCSSWDEDAAKAQVPGSDLLVSIGGDGTILRTARVSIPNPVPVLGINFGKLGFMTELKADDALANLPKLLSGAGWIEERAVLEARLPARGLAFYALNDVFVGRRASARVVTIEAKLNGEMLAAYRADGVLVATASGSTGYSMAVSGPILHPESREVILKPVCAHFTFDKALVLSPNTVVSLKVTTTHEAMLSNDGQVEVQLQNGDEVEVKLSEHRVRFLRMQPRSYFYTSLESKLREKIV